MPIVVRPVQIDDLQSVAELLVEMDEFYDEPDREPAAVKVANMREFLFGAAPSAYAIVAHEENEQTVRGVAAYSFLWPAVGTTRSLYLKELYVSKANRRGGVGRALMVQLSKIARESHCSRVEWTTDRENTEAQQFYDSLGAVLANGKILYRST